MTERNLSKEKLFLSFFIVALFLSVIVAATVVGPDGTYDADYSNATIGNFVNLFLDGVNYTDNIISGGGWDGTGALFQNGTRELTDNWEVGTYNVTADNFTATDFYLKSVGNLTAYIESEIGAATGIRQASYLIHWDGSDFYGINGSTGQTDYTESSFENAVEWAWGNLSTGGLIELRGEGQEWQVDGELNSQAANVTIRGGGKNNPTIKLKGGLDTDVFDITHDFTKILYLDIDGNWTGQTMDAGASTNAVSRAIRNSGDSAEFAYNYIHHVAQHAITFASCEGGFAHHNLIEHIGWNGIFTMRLASPGYGIIISENEFAHIGDVAVGCYGSRTMVRGNYIHDMDGINGSLNTQWGIGIEGGDWNTIDGNIIDDCLQGIATGSVGGEDPQWWSITNNLIMGLSNAVAGGNGINIKARNGIVSGNTIAEIPNWAAPWNQGIHVEAGSNNVQLVNNQYYGAGAYLGVQISSENDITVDGDQFHGTPWGAVRLVGACHRLQLVNGRVYDGARGIISDAVAQCDDVTIDGWYFYSLDTVAIDIQDCDDLFVKGNTIRDCAIGLDISNANVVRAIVDGNDFYGCTTDVSALGAGVDYGGNKDQNGNWDENAEP